MFGILLLSGLIVIIPAVVVMGLFGALAPEPADTATLVRTAIAYVVVGTLATPFVTGVTGLLYVDQRIRQERLDLELARYPAPPR
jgi:Na+/serine symporter